MKLDRMDAQVLAAASLLATSIISAGKEGALMLNALEDKFPRIIPLSQSSILLLEKSKPLSATDRVERENVPEDVRDAAFRDNMQRLVKLGKQLMLQASGRVAAAPGDAEDLPRIIEVGPDGSPIFDKPLTDTTDAATKLYNLQLTHDDIHVLFWALKFAEAMYQRDSQAFTNAAGAYRQIRRDDETEEKLDSLVERFNATHAEARRDAGEID